MKRIKTFFIYFLLIVGFYLISKVLISFAIHTRVEMIPAIAKVGNTVVVTAKASGIDAIVNATVINGLSQEEQNQYLKIDYYSKDNILLGTKYIETGKIGAKEKEEFEIRANYVRVKRVEVQLVTQIPEGISEENTKTDQEQKGVLLLTAVTLLCLL